MRFVIIGPGFGEIPPKGWGAVEILIWDYKQTLEEKGHEVLIVNKPNKNDIILEVNNYNPDIVHIHYDDWWYIWNDFNCKKVIITNHYAYMECPHRRNFDFVEGITRSGLIIHCLSEGIKNVYLSYGVSESRLFVLQNGANEKLFKYKENPKNKEKSLYLAKIDYRKRQKIYQNIECIDFVGNIADTEFNPNCSNYLGEWSKEQLYENLTEYSALVLLSDGEAHPLVCCEALVSGLGLVVSEFAAANLDRSKPYITVIPTDKLNDIEYIQKELWRTQKIGITMRNEIRKYGLEKFSWSNVIDKYLIHTKNLLY